MGEGGLRETPVFLAFQVPADASTGTADGFPEGFFQGLFLKKVACATSTSTSTRELSGCLGAHRASSRSREGLLFPEQ